MQQKKHGIKLIIFGTAVAISLSACAKKTPEPKMASSAGSPGYAVAYPDALSQNLTHYADNVVEIQKNTDAFSDYPSAFKDPDWQVVTAAYVQADQTGRGREYAEKIQEQRAVERFFEEEKDDIARRTNGAVLNALEKAKCGCDVETGGAVSYGLKDGVEKRLEKRLLEVGGVDQLIEDNEKSLGKKNAATLTEQTNNIAFSAYLVFVELPTLYQTVSRQLTETEDVRDTIQQEITRQNGVVNDPDASKGDKKKAQKDLEVLNGALTTIDIFKAEAERFIKESETQIPELQKKYEKAIDTLIDDVERRQSSH